MTMAGKRQLLEGTHEQIKCFAALVPGHLLSYGAHCSHILWPQVQGYVRSVSSKGLFLALDRAHTARIKLGQLSDGFIEDPAAAFPVGSRVEGRVLSVEHTKPQPSAAPEGATTGSSSSSSPLEDDGVRVELSLRSAESSGQLRTLADIQEGELSGGKVGSNTWQALCLYV